MKLIRFGEPGSEKPGLVLDDTYIDASEFCSDYNEDFFRKDGLTGLQTWYSKNKGNLRRPLNALKK